jgi:hypothetical protein
VSLWVEGLLPDGFACLESTAFQATLTYQGYGTGNLKHNLWLMIVVCIVLAVCVSSQVNPAQIWAMGAVAFGYLIACIWLRTVFVLRAETLKITLQIFGFTLSSQIYLKRTITAIKHSNDHDSDDNHHPTWALIIHVPSKVVIFSKQDFASGDWLGQVLSAWSGVGFQAADIKS